MDSSSLRYRYGICGNFVGDEKLEESIRSFEEGCYSSCNEIAFERLVNLSEKLPPKGQRALSTFLTKEANISQIDQLLKVLLDYCLTNPETDAEANGMTVDEDFVLIPSAELPETAVSSTTRDRVRSTAHPLRYVQWQILLTLIPAASSKVAADVCQKYLWNCSSTQYRSSILRFMVSNPEISNDQLFELYKLDTTVGQDFLLKMIVKLKRDNDDQNFIDKRVQVLETLLDENIVARRRKYFYEASSEYVQKELKADPNLSLDKWNLHKKVYLEELHQRLETCRIEKDEPETKKTKLSHDQGSRPNIDRIKCGEIWNKFIGQIAGDLDQEAVENLIQLLEIYKPCRIKSSLPLNARLHLKGISERCDQDVLEFENDIEQIPLKRDLVTYVPRLTIKQKAIHAMNTGNFNEFKFWTDELGMRTMSKVLLTYLKGGREKELWNYIIKKNKEDGSQKSDGESNKDHVVDNAFFSFFSDLLHGELMTGYQTKRDIGLTIESIKSWWQLHKNSTPNLNPLSDQNMPGISWKQWFVSYMTSQQEYSQTLMNLLIDSWKNLRPLDDSQISLYAAALKFLIEKTNEAVQIARDHVSKEFLFQSVWRHFSEIYKKISSLSSSSPYRLVELITVLENVIQNEYLVYLKTSLNFDPRLKLENDYADNRKIKDASDMLISLINHSKSESTLKACFSVCSNWLFRAREDNNHEPTSRDKTRFYIQKDVNNCDKNKCSFIFVNSSVHIAGVRESIRCFKSLVSKEEAPVSLKKEIWKLLKQNSKAANIDKNVDFITYVCSSLPEELHNEEIDEIKRRVCIELKDHKASLWTIVSSLSDNTDLLHAVLDSCEAMNTAREAILQDYGQFKHKVVQNILKEKTEAPTADERAQAYSIWLQRALTLRSPSEFVYPFNYAAIKIKNESGLHKKRVFETIGDIVPKMVESTLSHADVKSATSLCPILLQIVSNDLDRRDSVGSKYFHSISSKIMKITLQFDPLEKLNDIRRIWISTAVKMKWLLTRSQGDITKFRLPIEKGLSHPVCKWVNQCQWDETFPHKEFPEKLAEIRRVISLKSCVKTYNDNEIFDLNNAVNNIVDGLTALWDCTKYGKPFDVESDFKYEEAFENNLSRLGQLFQICSFHWEESEHLVKCFDILFGDNLRNSSKEHFMKKESFFKKIFHECARYKWNGNHPNRRLSKAVDAIFRYAVDNQLQQIATSWLGYWTSSQLYSGKDQWQSVDHRISRFLAAFNIEPQKDKTEEDNSVQLYNNKCLFLNSILSSTRSAIFLDTVWDIMFHCRPDIISEYCSDEKIYGVFVNDSKTSSNAISCLYDKAVGIKAMSFFLRRFPSEVCAKLASHASNLCLDQEKDIGTRVIAAEIFATCITTSNTQIIQLLDNQILEPPLVEAITLKIFKIDSPWLILGFLLNAEMLQRRNQSATASLLRQVSKHVPLHQVVKTLSLMLSPSRRKVLGTSLMKAIVRLLFQARSPRALHLLDLEWQNEEIHKDIKSEILLLCFRSVLERKKSDTMWEWKLLHSVVAQSNVEEDVGLMFLSIGLGQDVIGVCGNRWKIGDVFQPPPQSQPIEEVHGKFELLAQSSNNLEKRSEFFTFAKKLSKNLPQPDLQRAANLMKWKISQDIQNTIQEMKDALLVESDLDEIWNDDWIQKVSSMYVSAFEKYIQNAVKQSCDQNEGSTKEDCLPNIYAENEVAKQTSSFVKSLVLNSSGGRLVQRRDWMILRLFSSHRIFADLSCFKDDLLIKTLRSKSEDASCVSNASSNFINHHDNRFSPCGGGGYGGRGVYGGGW